MNTQHSREHNKRRKLDGDTNTHLEFSGEHQESSGDLKSHHKH